MMVFSTAAKRKAGKETMHNGKKGFFGMMTAIGLATAILPSPKYGKRKFGGSWHW